MIRPMDISRRRAVQGVIGLVCSIALAVTGVAAQAAPLSAAAPQVTPSPSPAASPEPTATDTPPASNGDHTDDVTPDVTPDPSPSPSPTPSVVPDAVDHSTDKHKRVDVPANPSAGPRNVGNGRLDSPAAKRATPPPFATDTFHVQAHGAFKGAADAGQRPGNSLVVGVGAPEPEVVFNGVELHPGQAKKQTGYFYNRATNARANRNLAVEGGVVSISQFPGASKGFINGSAFGLRVTTGGPNQDAQWVDLALDANSINGVYGANYVDRMKFVLLPDCALERPNDAECLTGLPLETKRDGHGIVTVTLPANARDIDNGGKGYTAPTGRVVQSGDLAAELAASQGLHFAAPGGGTIVAAVSGAQGQTGDFSATDLAPKGTWGVSEQSGAFTYSVPIDAPPAQYGPAPSIALSYSSASTDGKTENTNGQTSLLGEGWATPSNYIERHYISCYDDGYQTTKGLADRCWQSPYTGVPGEAAYTISLNGATYDLIWDGDNRYRTDTEIGWRVTRQTGGPNPSEDGDDTGEYFLVQTPDGSRYYFGYGAAGANGAATNSVATVPVFGDDDGEPRCHGNGHNDFCQQGYRWMLDIALDPSDNAMIYYYTQEMNYYSVKGDTDRITQYTRAIDPDHIDYGLVWDSLATGVEGDYEPQARVEFALVDRCVELANYRGTLDSASDPDYACPDESLDNGLDDYANVNSYPDVPVDLMCKEHNCVSSNSAPTFFTTKRLDQINTYVWDVADEAPNTDWIAVDTTQLVTAFPITGDGSARNLWLDSIYTHAWGKNEFNDNDELIKGDDDLDTYLIKFDPIQLNNRVDYIPGDPDRRAVDRLRIERVRTEFGGHIEVTYARMGGDTDGVSTGLLCPQTGITDPADSTKAGDEDDLEEFYDGLFPEGWDLNKKLCFPSTNEDDSPTFHKYLVTQVRLIDAVAPVPDDNGDDQYLTSYNNYDYKGDPAWVYSDDVLSDRADFKGAWSVFRGFEKVESWTGKRNDDRPAEGYPVTINQYYRGLSNKYLANGTLDDTVMLHLISTNGTPDPDPTRDVTVEDLPELAGNLAATKTVRRAANGASDTEVVSASHSTYTVERAVSQPTYDVLADTSILQDVVKVVGLGDYDSDGDPDLLLWRKDPNTGESTASIVEGTPSGVGDASANSWVGDLGTGIIDVIATGDWNNDGRVDFARQGDSHSDYYLWKGNSAGNFTYDHNQNVQKFGSNSRKVVVGGQWTGNDNPDSLYIDPTSGDLSLRRGDGNSLPATDDVISTPSDETKNRFADFDGDGRTDVTNHQLDNTWLASYSGTGVWWKLLNSGYGPDSVRFDGDFDSEPGQPRKADALHLKSSGWDVSYDSKKPWEDLNSFTSTLTTYFEDLDGDGKDEMVRKASSGWQVSKSGTGAWTSTGYEALPTSGSLEFADINGDGKMDILHYNGTAWDVWYEGLSANHETLGTADGSGDLTLIGNFDDTVGDDLIRFHEVSTGVYEWQVAPGFLGPWEKLVDAAGSGEDFAYNYKNDFVYDVADFDGNGQSDILRYGDGGWAVLTDAAGSWTPIALSKWANYTEIVGGFDFDGNGQGDVFGIAANGNVFLHNGDGSNTFPAFRTGVLDHLNPGEQLVVPGDWTGDGVNDLMAFDAANKTLKLYGGEPRVTGGDGKHYAQIVRVDQTWSMTQETTDNTPAENGDNWGAAGTERTWRQESTSHTAYDGVDFLPVSDTSTVKQWVWVGAPDFEDDPESTHTTCALYDNVWGIRDASGNLLGDYDANGELKPNTTPYTDVAGWGGTTYLSATWRTRSYEDACPTDEIPDAGKLVGVSEGYFDDADWTRHRPSDQADALRRGLPTMEVTYPKYERNGTDAANRAGASVAVADYDERGRIKEAWTPEAVTVDATTSHISKDGGKSTTWSYGGYECVADPAPMHLSLRRAPLPHQVVAVIDGGRLVRSGRRRDHGHHQPPELPGAGYSSNTWTEPTRGLAVMSEDINGSYTHYRYDAFGLLTEGYAPSLRYNDPVAPWHLPTTDYVVPSVSFVYDVYAPGQALRNTPVAVVSGQNMGFVPGGDPDDPTSWACLEADCHVNRSYTFMDGFGRVIEQQSPAPDGSGKRLVTATRYNGDGQVQWSAGPYSATGTASLASGLANPMKKDMQRITIPTYDWAGRTIAQTSRYVVDTSAPNPENKDLTTKTASFGNISQTRAPSGAITETKNDIQGRLASQAQHGMGGYGTDTVFTTTYSYAVSDGDPSVEWASEFLPYQKEGFSKVTVKDPEAQ